MPGRFKNWPERTVEDAGAVWTIRNLSFPSSPLDAKRGTRNVPNAVVKRVQAQATSILELLVLDCKQAARFFRSYLFPKMLPSEENGCPAGAVMQLSPDTLHPFVPSYLSAVEKVRHKIALDKTVVVSYRWTIQENGASTFEGHAVHPRSFGRFEIKLEVTHLNPIENGYSKGYGFPNLGLFEKNGFKDIFKITEEGVLDERFKILPSGDTLKEIGDVDDPDGFADYLADLEYHDFY